MGKSKGNLFINKYTKKEDYIGKKVKRNTNVKETILTVNFNLLYSSPLLETIYIIANNSLSFCM